MPTNVLSTYNVPHNTTILTSAIKHKSTNEYEKQSFALRAWCKPKLSPASSHSTNSNEGIYVVSQRGGAKPIAGLLIGTHLW